MIRLDALDAVPSSPLLLSPALRQSCCKPSRRSQMSWQVQGSLVVIRPLNTALSPFQDFIQGGCVKYCDPGAASPASVASWGREGAREGDRLRPHMQAALQWHERRKSRAHAPSRPAAPPCAARGRRRSPKICAWQWWNVRGGGER